MRGWSVIYADGSSRTIWPNEADKLRAAGLIVPHPGAGYHGITGGDWTLAEGVTWEQVSAEAPERQEASID